MNYGNEIYRDRINKVIDYVNKNLNKSFSLEELAKIALFSSFHFHKIFVALTGESLNFFTNRLRLEKAARLLKYSDSKISNVAFECGFSSPSTLSRSFKKHFGISPKSYQQGEEIDVSKICKEFFPYKDYLEDLSDQQMKELFPVTVQTFPERRIAYIRVTNAYEEGKTLMAYEEMIKFAKEYHLFESQEIFGMSIDDPMTTPKEQYRYEVCISLPDNYEVPADFPLAIVKMPVCSYATTIVSGNLNRVATGTYYLFEKWLVNSSYEPEHQHGLEIFLDKENIFNWDHFDLKLCIPVKKIKS